MCRIPFIILLPLGLFVSCTPRSSQPEVIPLGEGKPCENCVRTEAPQFEIQEEFLRLEGQNQFQWETLPKPMGLLPIWQAQAHVQGKCSFCHAFSDDAVAFDFQSSLESWLLEIVPRDSMIFLIPGLGLPDKDSLGWEKILDTLANLPFLDQKPLSSMVPWLERPAGAYQVVRRTPASLRAQISRLAARSGVRSLLIPLFVRVEILPKEGKEGAYKLDVLWSLWNAEGERLWMIATHVKYCTTNSVPPDRNWSAPHFQMNPPPWNTSEL